MSTIQLSRRDFLKTGATAALGATILSQIGFAPARALPAPYAKLYGGKKIPSVCPYCAVGCTVIGTVIDGQVVDVSPDLEAPHTEGTLCSKGEASMQLLPQFNPYRLRRPSIRTNPKKGETEDPRWREITWQEAWDTIVKKYAELYKEWEKNKPWLDAKGNYLIPGGRNLDDKEKQWQLHPRAMPVARLQADYGSNEEIFLGRKLAMLMGTNNTDIEARRCHSTTVAGLADVYGFGVMTNSGPDFQNTKVMLNIGSNHAEQHPVVFRFTSRAIERGAKLLVFDPRFGRTASKAHLFAWFRPGTELAIILGIMRYAIENRLYDKDYLDNRTDAPKHFKTGGLLTDWETNPDSVFGQLKAKTSRFTPQEVERITGVPAPKFIQMTQEFTDPAKRPGQITWCIGCTQHTCGTQIIRALGMTQMLLGNVGNPGGGANVLRGITNVQGSNDMNHLMHIWLGYRRLPGALGERERAAGGAEADIRRYQKYKNLVRAGKSAAEIAKEILAPPHWTGDLRHYASWREAEREWGIFIGTFPETDPDKGVVISDVPVEPGLTTIEYFREAEAGRINIIFFMGMNPVVSVGNANQVMRGLQKEGVFTVVMDIFLSETAHFADIVLPSAGRYESSGSVTNTGHTVQWRHQMQDDTKVTDPFDPQKRKLTEIKQDLWAVDQLFKRLRKAGLIKLPSERFAEARGVPLSELRTESKGKNLDELWEYRRPDQRKGSSIDDLETLPEPFEVSKEIDKTVRVYRGIIGPNGENRMARRDKTFLDTYTQKWQIHKNWAFSWPDNQRNMYDPRETAGKTGPLGLTFFKFDGRGTFWSPFYARRGRGIPDHYEPAESPDKELVKDYPPLVGDHPYFKELGITPPAGTHPGNTFAAGMVLGTVEEGYDVIATSFRLTEHQHTGVMTRNLPWLAEMMPEHFVEISPSLAQKLGVKSGDRIRVSGKRHREGIVSKALVTNRVRPLVINGKLREIIAMPWAWGFAGPVKGVITNLLFPDAMDEETGMPETKIALVKVERA